MKTVFSIIMLSVMAIVVNYTAVFALNGAGFPGAILAGMPGKRSKRRYVFGAIISVIGQSYIYLAYTAFVVNWTMLARSKQGVLFIVWPIAFLAANVPLWLNLNHARAEAREMEYPNTQTKALHLTTILALIGFFLFAFSPKLMKTIYAWVPYI